MNGTASQWHDQFLVSGQAGLKSRTTQAVDEDSRWLQARIWRSMAIEARPRRRDLAGLDAVASERIPSNHYPRTLTRPELNGTLLFGICDRRATLRVLALIEYNGPARLEDE